MNHHAFLSVCRILCLFAGISSQATAGAAPPEFPEKPIRLIVPTNPGGSIDTIARILGAELSNQLKQSVIVENRTGASGMIAASTVAQAPRDGYTLLITHTGVLQADLLHKNSSYRLSDLAPVAEVSNTPVAFGVGMQVPVTDLQSFVQLAKEEPEKLSYGSYGKGTSAHIWAEQFSQHAGIKLIHVPYGGEIPALQDMLAGRITSAWGAVGTYKQYADAHKIRIIAVANPVRSVLLPDVPTFIEAGYPEMNASGWCGIFAPVGTPKTVIEKVSQAVLAAVHRKDVADRILVTGQEPTGTDQDTFGKRVAHDRQTWQKAISDLHITLD
ncbi:Bug family tripartite tricarboxylate transporter substrate binding protein [Achromobacter aloeverae]|uniref:Tripartite tricarboxylate transporter substrate binding protein n=1 Tax=Achromobacter aloeverae TaxID=1750518 RepID=A0A4Q1HIY1_9BURK|nr:tripartite tricarboxylate transporter substrate binding protein [Achromobacter aloeverae]RXN88047.1 tripartite tricarboxylate transporter substrate binding protein [Achromobacter aloeverae]